MNSVPTMPFEPCPWSPLLRVAGRRSSISAGAVPIALGVSATERTGRPVTASVLTIPGCVLPLHDSPAACLFADLGPDRLIGLPGDLVAVSSGVIAHLGLVVALVGDSITSVRLIVSLVGSGVTLSAVRLVNHGAYLRLGRSLPANLRATRGHGRTPPENVADSGHS